MPRPLLQHHQSFNHPASSSARARAPRRSPSHAAQLLSTNLPQIRFSLDPGDQLNPGLKQEISQQVREFRAQKLQRGHSPGSKHGHSQITSQGLSKGPSQGRKEGPNQGPVSQFNPMPSSYLLEGASNQKEKPRGRPRSAPSQAAIEGPKSQGPQGHPQSAGQFQKPQSASNPVSKAQVKLVSVHPRGRSHSPCFRVDVDPDDEGEWWKGMRRTTSDEGLKVPSDWEVTSPDCPDFLSRSFPESLFPPIIPRDDRNFLSSSYNNLLCPPSNNDFQPIPGSNRDGSQVMNARRAASSMCDLSASAPESILQQNFSGSNVRYSRSADNLMTQKSTAQWLGLSPRTSPQTSPTYSPTSTSSQSTSDCSPLPMILIQSESPYPLVFSSRSSQCSPYGSPFGSQTQIYVGSVGAEC